VINTWGVTGTSPKLAFCSLSRMWWWVEFPPSYPLTVLFFRASMSWAFCRTTSRVASCSMHSSPITLASWSISCQWPWCSLSCADKKEARAPWARGGCRGGMPLDLDMSMALDVASSPSLHHHLQLARCHLAQIEQPVTYLMLPCLYLQNFGVSPLGCNTPGATKAQDVTSVPSLIPEYKTQQQKPLNNI